MPVNNKLLEQHLDSLNNTNNGATPNAVLSQLEKSFRLLEKLTIKPEPPVIITGYRNHDHLIRKQLEEGEPPRHWRYRLINKLARLSKQASNLTTNNKAELQGLHEQHRKMADAIRWTASHDQEPGMTYIPFAQSLQGQQAIDEAGRMSDTDAAREHIQKIQADQIMDHINQQLPVPADEATANKLTPREVLIIGKDVWQVADLISTNTSPSEMTAQVFRSLKDEGRINGHPLPAHYAELWEQASAEGFDKRLDRNQEPGTRTYNGLQDRLPHHNAITLANRASKNFDITNIEISYYDNQNPDDPSLKNLTTYTPNHSRVVVTENEDRSLVVATQWHPETPNHVVVTAPGRGHRITHIPESASNNTRLDIISEAASDLPRLLNPHAVQKRLDQIREGWRALPTTDAKSLKHGLDTVQQELKGLAANLPPPGYGTSHQDEVTADLIKLNLLLGREYNLTPISFSTPSGMNTASKNCKPDREVIRTDNGDGTTDIHFMKTDDATSPFQATGEWFKGIANDNVQAMIATAARTEGWTLGAKALPHEGLSVFAPPTENSHAGNIYVGHWMSDESIKKTTCFTPIGALHKNATGDPLFLNPKLPGPLRSDDEANQMSYATLNLMHDDQTPTLLLHEAYDTASFDGDYLIELCDGHGYPSCSGAQFNIHSELFHVASDTDLKTAVTQQIALSSVSHQEKTKIIENVQGKSWHIALMEAEESMNQSPESAEFEIPGMS